MPSEIYGLTVKDSFYGSVKVSLRTEIFIAKGTKPLKEFVMKFYKLEFERTIAFQYTENWSEFFIGKDDALNRKKELKSKYPRCSIYFSEVSFEEMKDEISVSDFESLFGITIDLPKLD